MERKRLVLFTIVLLSLALAVPVLADAPGSGTVVEGVSVPGIALGSTRAQVGTAYGAPYYCQTSYVPNDFAFCTYPVSGGGFVSVRYWGADGSFATNSPDDVVFYIGWGEPVSGWTTTAGINTALAEADRQAVLDAYPNAEHTIDGSVEKVIDWLSGIEVTWTYDGYTHSTHVYMDIFAPLPSLPSAQETYVQTIQIDGYRQRGRRHVNVWAEVLNEYERAATGAAVHATWILPDGSTKPAYEDFVGVDGVAFFQLIGKLSRGTYTLRIDNVALDGYTFAGDRSALSASVYVK